MADEPKQAPGFEASLAELEAVVKELESGELPLEKALELFARGTELSNACRTQLEEAETRVEQLVRKGSRVVAESLRTNGDT